MSTIESSTATRSRSRLTRVMKVVDRFGLGVIYVLVIAVVPLSAVGLWPRIV